MTNAQMNWDMKVEAIFLNLFRSAGWVIRPTRSNPKLAGLPKELIDDIIKRTHNLPAPPPRVLRYTTVSLVLPLRDTRNRPLIDRMVPELRAKIFSYLIPTSSKVITPVAPKGEIVRALAEGEFSRKKKTGNPQIDLMLVCKTFSREVATMIYSQQTYRVDIHQGKGARGGVEFLNAERQQLGYQVDITDRRFAKFSNRDAFGFARLKKVELLIFPRQAHDRHLVLNTYYMVQALARLLHRKSDDTQRLNQLTVRFHELPGLISRQDAWFDINSGQPRSTSIHGISDVELVLRPLSSLSHVQSVRIFLPSRLVGHQKTEDFTKKLEDQMLSTGMTLFDDGFLEQRLEAARDALEAWLLNSGP